MNTQDTSAEPTPDLLLQIAHVLLVDVVGYSKLLVNEQIELLHKLNQIVRGTESFRAADATGKLIRVPTGDGMALLFFHSPEEPVRCALEISKALQQHPHIQLRMGIHSGPVNKVRDVNDKTNFAGGGINVAQRVQDCGDAGHILLSAHIAEDLAHYRHWQPYLHDLGECEVKHGLRLHLFNLYKENLGNQQVPEKLKRRKRWKQASTVWPIGTSRWPRIVLVALLLSAIAVVISSLILFHRATSPKVTSAPGARVSTAASIPEKSIAVLPFENLSDEKENAYFADGIQDEILTDLARVADLKVISRTSVMQYKTGTKRNLREIATDLGVAHVLEGTVQRAGNRIRVSAQLIDARTDSHLWAERYDRNSEDVFAIQSEVAKNIVAQLKVNLSPSEKAAIDVRPTRDLEAFDLYLQAKQLINTFHETPDWKETLLKAIRLLDEAIARDGNFALAYCLATRANIDLYWFNLDHTPVRLAQARAMAQKALTLAPDSGEAHLAQALVYYKGDRDYVRAREELAIARRTLPNSAEVYSVTGWIDRRQGQWEDAVKNLEKAAELDPRNSMTLNDLAVLYDVLRRYDDEESVFARAIAANPSSATYFQLERAGIALQKGNIKTARNVLDSLPAGYDPAGATTSTRINLALYERDAASAAKILAASNLEELVGGTGSLLPRSWFEALIARAQGDTQKARDAFATARLKIEAKLHDQPNDGALVAMLGLIDAGLGHNEEALAEGRRAVELRPISNDALDGAVVIGNLAMIYAWVGDNNSAIERLTFLAKTPGGPDYGQLKFDPAWDGLRSDMRFTNILEGLGPAAAH
ncbi:MAG TPA: FlgO family outer membrane protein [Candidatus Limnocylindria bacterium]|nr:FlgO family outer membrane protein [Candidatus Limnocylindria bacterium]